MTKNKMEGFRVEGSDIPGIPDRYRMVLANTCSQMTTAINQLIALGWVPLGGASNYNGVIYQTMWRTHLNWEDNVSQTDPPTPEGLRRGMPAVTCDLCSRPSVFSDGTIHRCSEHVALFDTGRFHS